jgi:hypothetical protein
MPYQDVNVISPQPPETPFYGSPHLSFIMRVNLRLNIYLVPPSFENLSHHFLIMTMHIAICRVIKIDSKIKSSMEHGWVAAIHHSH